MSRNIAQAVTVGMLKLFKKNNINLQNLNFLLLQEIYLWDPLLPKS